MDAITTSAAEHHSRPDAHDDQSETEELLSRKLKPVTSESNRGRMIVMSKEDKSIATRLILMLILAIVFGILVLAIGCFFVFSSALQDPTLTIVGLYFSSSIEILSMAVIMTLFTMQIYVPSKQRLAYLRRVMYKNTMEQRSFSETFFLQFPTIAKRFYIQNPDVN
jgi:hypothetical protein